MQEILYNSIMEWVLRKVPSSVEQALMIDDTDKISSTVAVTVLMELYHLSSHPLQLQILCNLLCLVKGHPANHIALVSSNRHFLEWLLDICYMYQLKQLDSEHTK